MSGEPGGWGGGLGQLRAEGGEEGGRWQARGSVRARAEPEGGGSGFGPFLFIDLRV